MSRSPSQVGQRDMPPLRPEKSSGRAGRSRQDEKRDEPPRPARDDVERDHPDRFWWFRWLLAVLVLLCLALAVWVWFEILSI